MRTPDKVGIAGRAWNVAKPPETPIQEASLATWLVHAPASHPIWPYKKICLAHLRPIPGVPDATKHYPEAEFELVVLAVNPETDPVPDPDGGPVTLLLPADAAIQFHGIPDASAKRVCEAAVEAVVEGKLIPDEDYSTYWGRFIRDMAERLQARTPNLLN